MDEYYIFYMLFVILFFINLKYYKNFRLFFWTNEEKSWTFNTFNLVIMPRLKVLNSLNLEDKSQKLNKFSFDNLNIPLNFNII